jgi:hypothetical protein
MPRWRPARRRRRGGEGERRPRDRVAPRADRRVGPRRRHDRVRPHRAGPGSAAAPRRGAEPQRNDQRARAASRGSANVARACWSKCRRSWARPGRPTRVPMSGRSTVRALGDCVHPGGPRRPRHQACTVLPGPVDVRNSARPPRSPSTSPTTWPRHVSTAAGATTAPGAEPGHRRRSRRRDRPRHRVRRWRTSAREPCPRPPGRNDPPPGGESGRTARRGALGCADAGAWTAGAE